jgi:hypothetical protein
MGLRLWPERGLNWRAELWVWQEGWSGGCSLRGWNCGNAWENEVRAVAGRTRLRM